MLLYQLNKFESLLFSHLTRSPPFSAKITEYALHHGSCFMPTWPILQYQKRGCFSNIVPSFAYGMWHEQTSLQYPQNQPKGMCVSVWLVIMKIWQERDIVMFSVNRSRFMQSMVFFLVLCPFIQEVCQYAKGMNSQRNYPWNSWWIFDFCQLTHFQFSNAFFCCQLRICTRKMPQNPFNSSNSNLKQKYKDRQTKIWRFRLTCKIMFWIWRPTFPISLEVRRKRQIYVWRSIYLCLSSGKNKRLIFRTFLTIELLIPFCCSTLNLPTKAAYTIWSMYSCKQSLNPWLYNKVEKFLKSLFDLTGANLQMIDWNFFPSRPLSMVEVENLQVIETR